MQPEHLRCCRQVQVSVDDRHLTTCAAKGEEPEWNETLEFFLVAPQLEQEELCIEIEVRDIHMLDDVKVHRPAPSASACATGE